MARPKRKAERFNPTPEQREERVIALAVRAGWINHLMSARKVIRDALHGNREAAMAIFNAIEAEAHLTAPTPDPAPVAELWPVN